MAEGDTAFTFSFNDSLVLPVEIEPSSQCWGGRPPAGNRLQRVGGAWSLLDEMCSSPRGRGEPFFLQQMVESAEGQGDASLKLSPSRLTT